MKSLVGSMVAQIAGKKPDLPMSKAAKVQPANKKTASLHEMLASRPVSKVASKAPVKPPVAKKAPVVETPAVVELSPEMAALSNRARVLRFLDQGPAPFDKIQAAVQLTHRQLENVLYQLAMPNEKKIVRLRDDQGKSIWRLSAGAAASPAMVSPPRGKRAETSEQIVKDVNVASSSRIVAKAPLPQIVQSVPATFLQIKANAKGVATVTGLAVDRGEVPVAIAEILLRAAREVQALRLGGLKHSQVLVLAVEKT